jgi:hypothetical protein
MTRKIIGLSGVFLLLCLTPSFVTAASARNQVSDGAFLNTPFALPAAAQTSTNVVPNPGFEQSGCNGSTPDVCGWDIVNSDSCGGAGPCTSTTMYEDTANPHSGSASLYMAWGTSFSDGWGGVGAATDPAFCAAIGPGAHPASLWYANADGESVAMNAVFYQTPDCTGASSSYSLSDIASGNDWKQVTGTLVAPPGTESALFTLGSWVQCDYAGGCSVAANFDDLDVESFTVTNPVISSFTPGSGPTGTSVDILGVNFTGATSVTFNDAAASFTVDSDTEIHATVPTGAATGPISVTTANGTATTASSFGVPPTISSFTPTCGPVGASVDVLGTRFVAGATLVGFNGTPASSVTVNSDSELHAIIPSYETPGPISVSTAGGDARSTSWFTGSCALPPPTINSLTPTSGPLGTGVDIQGTNFTGATGVKFNGTADPSFVVNSSTDITAHVPNGATTGPITVTTANGATTSSSSFAVKANAPPTSRFTFICTALTCSFDGGASSDPDGAIASYSWSFGDGTTVSGSATNHTYLHPAGYVVTLTVTDNDGATGTDSETITPMILNAQGYKQRRLEKVDLSWSGPGGESSVLYRNNTQIAALQGTTYTDTLGRDVSGTYTYRVCVSAASTCSNNISVSF